MNVNRIKQLVLGSAFIFVGNVIGVGANFFTRILAARHLGPSSYGTLVLGVSILNITSLIILLGLPQGLAQKVPRNNDWEKYILPSFLFVLSMSVLTVLIMYSNIEYVTDTLSASSSRGITLIFLFSVPFWALTRLSVGFFRGLESASSRIITQDIILKLGTLVIVGSATSRFLQLDSLAYAWLFPAIMSFAIGFPLIYCFTENSIRSFSFKSYISSFTHLLRFSLPLMISQTAWMIMKQADNVFLSFYLQSNTVGIYDASYTIASILLIIINTIGFLYLPSSSKLDSDNKDVGSLYTKLTELLVFVTTPMAVFIIYFNEDIFDLVYGAEYISTTTLVVVVIGFYIHVVAGLNGFTLVSIGRNKAIMYGNISALIFNIVMNVLLIPNIGMIGAAVASSITYLCVNLYWSYLLYSNRKIKPLSAVGYKTLILSLLISILLLASSYHRMSDLEKSFLTVSYCIIYSFIWAQMFPVYRNKVLAYIKKFI